MDKPTFAPTPAPSASPTTHPTTPFGCAKRKGEYWCKPKKKCMSIHNKKEKCFTPAPTPSPTFAPTPFPTSDPTDKPTHSPTFLPSAVPSPSPTDQPTYVPTATPVPKKCVDGTIKSCREYFDCAEPAGGYKKKTGIYQITVAGDIIDVYCLMNSTIDKGGWTQVMNLDTQDGIVQHYQQQEFWESANSAGKAQTDVRESLRADYKNPPVFGDFKADQILVVLHRSGEIQAWRSWELTKHATLRSFLKGGMAASGSHCSAALGSDQFREDIQLTSRIRHTSPRLSQDCEKQRSSHS